MFKMTEFERSLAANGFKYHTVRYRFIEPSNLEHFKRKFVKLEHVMPDFTFVRP